MHYLLILQHLPEKNFNKYSISTVQKTSIGVCFTMAYAGEKMKKQNNKQANMVLPVSPKVGVGNSCLMLLMFMMSYKAGGKIELPYILAYRSHHRIGSTMNFM